MTIKAHHFVPCCDSLAFTCRYAETVIHRIFYALDRTRSGRLSHRQLRRSDLLQVDPITRLPWHLGGAADALLSVRLQQSDVQEVERVAVIVADMAYM